jgi:hypothetical protein
MALTFIPNDVNRNGAVTGADAFLINQVAVGLRNFISSVCDPPSKAVDAAQDITIYGQFGSISSLAATIGAPVSVTCSSVVKVDAYRITCTVPAGGGEGTGTLTVTGTGLVNPLHFATFTNTAAGGGGGNPAPDQFTGLAIYADDELVGMSIANATAPTNISLLNLAEVPMKGIGIAVNSGRAAICGSRLKHTDADTVEQYSGFMLFSLGNPKWPKFKSVTEAVLSSGVPVGLAISGNFLYAACGSAGLKIYDISNLEAPSLQSTYNTAGFANHVAISGTNAFVADAAGGLVALNVSTPTSPVLAGTVVPISGGNFKRVFILGTTCYAAGNNCLDVIDITNPASMSRLGIKTGIIALGVFATATNRVYVAGSTSGCYIFDCSTPSAITTLATIPNVLATPNTKALDVWASGNYLYVDNFDSGIWVHDISVIGAPVLSNAVSIFGPSHQFVGAVTS